MRRPLVTDPFAAVIYADSLYVGVRLLADPSSRRILASVLPGWEALAVAVMLALGGLLTLTGLVVTNRPRMERAGLVGLALGLAVFVAVALARGFTTEPNVYVDLGFVVASALRWRTLGRSLRLREVTRGRH